MRDSSYRSNGLPTTQGNTEVGKFSPAKPHFTYCVTKYLSFKKVNKLKDPNRGGTENLSLEINIWWFKNCVNWWIDEKWKRKFESYTIFSHMCVNCGNLGYEEQDYPSAIITDDYFPVLHTMLLPATAEFPLELVQLWFKGIILERAHINQKFH